MDDDQFRRLDMNHGFIKSIVKNQIDRDEFHKVMEERKAEVQQKIREKIRPGAETSLAKRKTLEVGAECSSQKKDSAPESEGESEVKRKVPIRAVPKVEEQLYVPPHLRKHQAMSSPTTTKQLETKVDVFSPSVVSHVEESTLREKVRSRVLSQLDGVDDLPLGSSPSTEAERLACTPLFLLNIRNAKDEDVEVAVMTTDNAARLSKELSRKYGFNDDQCRMLRITLDRELEARLGK